MKANRKLHSLALASTVLILFLIVASSTASATAAQSVYITNYLGNSVSVIDTATNTVTATVPVGLCPYGVAVNPNGTMVYVTNNADGTVSVIDTAMSMPVATIPVGQSPEGVIVSPDGKKAYVVNENNATVSVINTATNTVTATVPVGSYPWGVAINPAGTKVYVTNLYSYNISIIDTATNTVTDSIPVQRYPIGIAVTPDGTKAYVTHQASNNVSVIDTAKKQVIATVFVGDEPYGVAINPAGTKVYVTNNYDNTVSVIDTTTNTITSTVTVGKSPVGVAITPDGTKAYVTNNADDTVSVIDTATNAVTNSVTVGYYPMAFGQSITPSQVQPVLPVANFSANPTSGTAPLNVSFIDSSTGTPTAWEWNFGDRTNSTVQNPVHKYSRVGNYTVSLTAVNAAGNNTITKKSYIKVTAAAPKPVANFTSNTTNGSAPLTVQFTDTSTGNPTAWSWSFGDRTNSIEQNPVHSYSRAGNYTVNLTVTNAVGNSTLIKKSYIKVAAATPKPVANFTSNVTNGSAPLTLQFTDLSKYATSWSWSFGDRTNSTVQNPVHKYSRKGNYTVALTAINSVGNNTMTKKSYIKVK